MCVSQRLQHCLDAHICSGTQRSAAFAPGPKKIAHSDFTCELKKNMKADFSAGEVGGEACWGGATSFLPKCSADLFVVLNSKMISSPENPLHRLFSFNILLSINKSYGKILMPLKF